MITITSGIAKTKDTITARMKHNLRREKKHRNIKNQNVNYAINSESEILEIGAMSKSERDKQIEDLRIENEKALNENFELLQKSKREGRVNRIERKSRLEPIREGIVNFGGVYDIKKDTLEEIEEKTKAFNNYIDENKTEIMKIVYKNLQDFAEKFNTEITNLVFHRDEKGLFHFHYFIKTYDKTTGEKLNFKHNKKNIGRELQNFISKDFEKYNIHRTAPDKKNRKKTKEQLQEFQEAQEENIKLKRENQKLKNENEELKTSISEYSEIIEKINQNINTLLTLQEEKKILKLKEKLTYILEHDNKNVADKLNKLFDKTSRQIGAINKKNGMRKL